MWNTYQRLVMRTSPPSEKYEIFFSPTSPYFTNLTSPPLEGLGEVLRTYFILSTQLNSLCQRIPPKPLRSGSLDHQMKIGLPTT